MFAAINIVAYILIGVCVSLKRKVNFIYSIPIINCLLVIVLFALSVINKIHYIGYISIFAIVISSFFIFKNFSLSFVKEHLHYVTTYAFVFGILILVFYLRKRVVLDWDELGVWALETKLLYCLNGFDKSNRLVALGYSKYYPAQMLFESWMCKLGGNTLIEGLMYVGYYYLYLSFCLPILGRLKANKIYKSVLCGLLIPILFLIIPSSVEMFGYKFLSVELLISAGFALLLHLLLNEVCNDKIKYLSIFSVSTTIIFAKESGVLFVLIALFVYGIYNRRKLVDLKLIIVVVASSIPTILWEIYCKRNMRSNYFVTISDSVDSVKDNLAELKKYICIIFNTLYLEPLHGEKTVGFDFTITTFIIFLIGIIILYVKYKIMNRKEAVIFVLSYIVLLGICFWGMAYMHAYILGEDQYYETSVMIKSLSRYLEPMFTGIFIYILTLPFVKEKYSGFTILGLICIIMCTSRYELVNRGIFNTKEIVAVANAEKDNINDVCSNLIESLDDFDDSKKVLLITTGENDFNKRRLRYEVCPTPIEFVKMSHTERVVEEIRQSVILYVEDGQFTDIYFEGFPDELLQNALGENARSNCLISADLLTRLY